MRASNEWPRIDKLLLQIRDHVGQCFAGSHSQLPFDQVVTRDHFGDRMLDLQPRIHLHEEKLAGRIGNELDRAGANVAHRFRRRDRGFAHRTPARCGHSRSRGFFNDFLMPPLHRTVALEQADRVAVAVGEHLYLDVPRPLHVLLDQHVIIAERRLGFALA